eukprot:1159461-Pelagomonas_calceolata.AAC.3
MDACTAAEAQSMPASNCRSFAADDVEMKSGNRSALKAHRPAPHTSVRFRISSSLQRPLRGEPGSALHVLSVSARVLQV